MSTWRLLEENIGDIFVKRLVLISIAKSLEKQGKQKKQFLFWGIYYDFL